MKLASLALVLGGTAVGTQLGTSDVHEEVHTQRLVLHSEDGTRTARISSDRAGIVIDVGDEESLTTARLKIESETERWTLSFEHELGTSFRVALDHGGATQLLSAGEGKASAVVEAFEVDGARGGGLAGSAYHPGGSDVPGGGCEIGVRHIEGELPHGFLHLRRLKPWPDETPGAPEVYWENVVQITGEDRSTVGPWARDED